MSDGKYSVELHVTPLNKNGKWGKRVKNYKVSGISNINKAKEIVPKYVEHLIKLSGQKTSTFFAEVFILKNEEYIDCDNSIVTCNNEKTMFSYDAA